MVPRHQFGVAERRGNLGAHGRFVTRPDLARVVFGRIAPDPRVVRGALERLGMPPIAAVVCVHSHYDHALDAPVWAGLTGADLVGSESTANIGRGLGVPEPSRRVVGGGDVLTYGRFELAFVETEHSPGDRYPGVVDAALRPPRHGREWRTGTVYAVFVSHPAGTVLVHASAGFGPGALHGMAADVVYLGVGTLGKQPARYVEQYWDEVVRATGAHRVVLVHWDDFFVSLDEPLRPLRRPHSRRHRSHDLPSSGHWCASRPRSWASTLPESVAPAEAARSPVPTCNGPPGRER